MNSQNPSGIEKAVVDGLRNGGLADAENRLVVLFSGGGDSVALLASLVELRGADGIFAMHVNYRLRGEDSEQDEQFCRDFCRDLGVELTVERASGDFAQGQNLQSAARDLRYALAERFALEHDCRSVVVAHSADDQAETVLYRLFASPGRSALHGMAPRRGRVVRPFLGLRRGQLREWCRLRGLRWREDASNEDPRFARVRARKLLAQAEQLHPAAIANLLQSADELRSESRALDAVVDDLLKRTTNESGRLDLSVLATIEPSLAARVLREFVERSAGRSVPAASHSLPEVVRLAEVGGSSELTIAGAHLAIEYGELIVQQQAQAAPDLAPEDLSIPGAAVFGAWRIEAAADAAQAGSIDQRDALTAEVELASSRASLRVRGRRPGDRMRPRGLAGSKSLQDLFVDKKLPRRLRDDYPVVCEGERIVWVPGIAVAAAPAQKPVARADLRATRLH